MPIRTGKQFLAELKDDRQIFMDGERIRKTRFHGSGAG
jgi:hypothetical protein